MSGPGETYDCDMGNQPWREKCVCGKLFMQPNSYALHIGCCTKFKKRLGQRLIDARKRKKDASTPQDPPNSTLDSSISTTTTQGTNTSSGSRWGKKRKPEWIDDSNLDVDIIIPAPSATIRPGGGSPHLQPMVGPATLANGLEDEEPEDHRDHRHEELGRGRRDKKLSFKIKPNTNFLPSSTLPASLFPSNALLQLPPPPQRSAAADTSMLDVSSANDEPPPPVAKVRMPANDFGLYKVFRLHGSKDSPHDPDNSTLPEDLREDPLAPIAEPLTHRTSKPIQGPRSEFYPFPNISSYRLGGWFWSDEGEKSQRSFHDLIDIVASEDFRPADIRDANWRQIDSLLANSAYDIDDMDSKEWVDDGISWKCIPVTLQVPFSRYTDTPGSHLFTVEGFHYRPLTPIIREKLESSAGREYFHTLGHELRWNPGHGKEHVRVYGELYTSPAFLQAYETLQKSPPEPDCNLPRHVIGLMFASDSTMLASFGTAKLWPLYMFYANDSKYRRAKPTEKLFETVAYFEKLPDNFKDFLIKISGKQTVNPALLTHCQRELFHEQWRHMLDDEFLHAYCHGIVVTCYDGLMRWFYPRIFTYSADYPEKILLASIKNLGSFPCPRCAVPMKEVPAMGKRRDRTNRVRTARTDDNEKQERVSKARSLIYDDNHPVTSTLIEGHLAYGSLIPTNNAFTDKLSRHGFNLFNMLVVDVMHEVELGVWKAVFIQLLRLMEASDKGSINKLDERYREMPTFGRDTIRRFTNNVSEMKRLAARDWEDLLQCSIPAFEGLLPPPHNARVMKLLFVFAQWHGMAKLRLHTDHTLTMLDSLTTNLGDAIREFITKTCSQFDTKELSREYQARMRRETKKKDKQGKGGGKAKQPAEGVRLVDEARPLEGQDVSGEHQLDDDDQPAKRQKTSNKGNSAARKKKTLNINTYKFHSLGDVVSTVRMFGTTDSYSTQIPELFHKYPKAHYKRTSRKNVSRQLSRIQMRQARIRKLRKQTIPEPDEGYQDDDAHSLPYFIGKSQNHPISVPQFVRSKRDDPAAKDFIPKLKRHLLPRIYRLLLEEAEGRPSDEIDATRVQLLKTLVKSSTEDPDFFDTPEAVSDADQVYLHSDRLYEHNILHINYTSYDVRRQTDIINPKTSRRHVMCLRQGEDEDDDVATTLSLPESPPPASHRFLHARVLGIFHANVIYRGRGAADLRRRRFDLLFVRWFTPASPRPALHGLDRLLIAPLSNANAVGFLDPVDILRASHILPRYSLGPLHPNDQSSHRLYPDKRGSDPIVSKQAKNWEDWAEYYINPFVDRDMLMRYTWGHGVGHAYCHGDAPPSVILPEEVEGDPANHQAPEDHPSNDTEELEHQDTLEDLEAAELEVAWRSDDDTSNGSEVDTPDPDDDVDW